MTERPTDTTSWLQPPEEAAGLRVYVETLRERWKMIALVVLITTAVAIAYVLTATKEYESQAEILVTPVSSSDPILATLGLITESNEPTRPIETASKFVTNYEVAQRAKKELGSGESAEALLAKISAAPIAQSNVVAVTAKADSAEFSQELANAFAKAAVADRTARLHERIETTIPQLEGQIAVTPSEVGGAGESLGAELALLQTLQNSPDPTISVDAEASSPGSKVWPRTALSVVAGIFAGLVIGITAAFAAQTLDPRLRREEQIRRRYRLPILARIPRDPTGRAEGRPLDPRKVEPITTEAYRTLRSGFLTRATGGGGRIVLVTGSSVAEGKTSTAVNLATSLALTGKRVILVESDLRRPSLARALDINTVDTGVVSTLLGNTSLEEALISLPDYGGNLRVLAADNEGGWIAELFSIPAAATMLENAAELADFVIIDSAPLTEVVDALPLALRADDVLIVVRLGRTRIDNLSRLTEMLADNGIKPIGFAIVNARRTGRNYDYHEKSGIAAGRRLPSGIESRTS
jgi:Mrp family chromosome partitioning ATPase/capsular polysaccharide biosynthesis protein